MIKNGYKNVKFYLNFYTFCNICLNSGGYDGIINPRNVRKGGNFMYPLLLKATLKDCLWGGERLKNEFGFNTELTNIGEANMLSGKKDCGSIVRNGSLAGRTLNEALESWGKAALGKNAAQFENLPILIKLIDAKDRLSVQVSPDDSYAAKNGGQCGNVKMWYVIDCQENAQIIYGFKQNISKGEFLERINNNTLSPVCNYVPVKKGDVFFIDTGTVHAVGKGVLLAQISQGADLSYRISDYGRLGPDKKPRKLHIKQAIEVTNTVKTVVPKNNCDVTLYPFGTVRELARNKHFKSELISLNGNVGIYDNDSFISLLVLDGRASLSYTGGMMSLKKGDSLFLPAGTKIRLSGTAQIIHTHI